VVTVCNFTGNGSDGNGTGMCLIYSAGKTTDGDLRRSWEHWFDAKTGY